MDQLKILKGGKVEIMQWLQPHEHTGHYVSCDITLSAMQYFFHPCELADNIKLNDIFLLIKLHIDIFKRIIHENAEEIINEGLTPYTGNKTTIDYLELNWYFDKEENTHQITGNILPVFQGFSQSNDIPFGLAFMAANEIAHLPVKLGCTSNRIRNLTLSGTFNYSLGQILSGIMAELAWNGSPTERARITHNIQRAGSGK